MSRPTRPISDRERAEIITTDAMLTLAESNLRAAVQSIRDLRSAGVPIRQLASRLGLSDRSVWGIGGDEAESGPLSTALVRLSAARQRGSDRRPTRDEVLHRQVSNAAEIHADGDDAR